MRKVVFFACSLLLPLRALASDPMPALLTALKNNPSSAYAEAEKLYENATENSLAVRLATLLSFAPAQDLKVPPHTYAQFAFTHDSSLPLTIRVKLARVAGLGLFNASQFDRARSTFAKALELKGLAEADREFFVYQAAWCEMNQSRPEKAFTILDGWLGECKECALRSSIVGDMGRAFGEAGAPEKWSASHVNRADETDFADGLSQGLERYFRSKKIGVCESLSDFARIEPKFRSRILLQKKLESCASGKATTKTAALMARLYEQLPDRTAHESLRLAEAYEHQSLNEKACGIRLLVLDGAEAGALANSLRVCARAGGSNVLGWAKHPLVLKHVSPKMWLEVYFTPKLKVIHPSAFSELKKTAARDDGEIIAATESWSQIPTDFNWSEEILDSWLQSTTGLLDKHRKHKWNDGALVNLNRDLIRQRLAQIRPTLSGEFAPVGAMVTQWRKRL